MRGFLFLVGLGIMLGGGALFWSGLTPVDWGLLMAGGVLAPGGLLLLVWGLTTNGKDACEAALVFLPPW